MIPNDLQKLQISLGEIELYRQKMLAITAITVCNTERSLERDMLHEDDAYWSYTYNHVVGVLRREISLYKRIKELERQVLVQM